MILANVTMPEKGVFQVRVDNATPPKCGERVIVSLDCGLDEGIVKSLEDVDPSAPGTRIPGFAYVRPFGGEGDERTIQENSRLASAMAAKFEQLARQASIDLRVRLVRLSFGRGRLFLRYTSDRSRSELSQIASELRRLFSVEVNYWPLGPRDAVACVGGIGPCGRVCCCASWQEQYPQNLNPQSLKGCSSSGGLSGMNGTCGRFKCCLKFER